MQKNGIRQHGNEGLYSSTSIQYIENKNWKQIQSRLTLELKEIVCNNEEKEEKKQELCPKPYVI